MFFTVNNALKKLTLTMNMNSCKTIEELDMLYTPIYESYGILQKERELLKRYENATDYSINAMDMLKDLSIIDTDDINIVKRILEESWVINGKEDTYKFIKSGDTYNGITYEKDTYLLNANGVYLTLCDMPRIDKYAIYFAIQMNVKNNYRFSKK